MTELTLHPEATPEDPQAVAAMLSKGQPTTATDGRPDWLPAGFNSPEQLAEAYIAATSGAHAAPKAAAEAVAEVAEEAHVAAVEAAGLNMADLEQKVASGDGLSAADYAALATAGIQKSTVDAYIAGQVALGEKLVADVTAQAGGADKLNSMLDWAQRGGLTAAESAVFNAAIDTGNKASIQMAISGLQARYAASSTEPPALLGGGRAGASGSVDIYGSLAQMKADMRDPRYANDPAFRREVEMKVHRSSIL